MAAKSNGKSDADAPKRSTVTREQLEKAAKLRAEGATWNEIREATGTKLGSGAFQKHWEREGIDHLPSHADDFKRAKAEREGRAHKPASAAASKRAPAAEAAPKPRRRTVKRSPAKTSGTVKK